MKILVNQVQAKLIGNKLKESRIYKGYTLSEVEKKLGINHGNITRIERGEFKFIAKNVQELCDLYKFDYGPYIELKNDDEIVDRIRGLLSLSDRYRSIVIDVIKSIEKIEMERN